MNVLITCQDGVNDPDMEPFIMEWNAKYFVSTEEKDVFHLLDPLVQQGKENYREPHGGYRCWNALITASNRGPRLNMPVTIHHALTIHTFE